MTGVTFAPEDPADLTEAVHALLSDRERARVLARRARAMVHEQYGWSAIAQRTATAYASAIAGDAAFTAQRAEQRMATGRVTAPIPGATCSSPPVCAEPAASTTEAADP